MLPTYPYATCRLDIFSTSADTVFDRVADMLVDMSATCRADTHVSVDFTIFWTFKNPTFPAKVKVTAAVVAAAAALVAAIAAAVVAALIFTHY
jgi:hypothetical protein